MTAAPSPEIPPVPPSRSWDTGCLLIILWSLIRVPPWRPLFLVDGLDPSWMAVLNEAVTGPWRYGTDILFTYGPLGFLHNRVYHPDTHVWLMVGWLATSWVLATSLWRISGQVCTRPLARFLSIVVAIDLLSRNVMAMCFSLQAALFLIVLPLQRAPHPCPQDDAQTKWIRVFEATNRLLLILLIAALPWSKFSYFPSVVGLTICLAGAAVFLQHRFPTEAAGLVVSSLLIWFGTGHNAAELKGYLLYGLELASGYSIAMGMGPETLSGWLAVVTAAVITLCLPFWFSRRAYDRPATRWLATLFFGGLLFLVFKSAFVLWHWSKLATFLYPVLLLVLLGLQCAGDRVPSLTERWRSRVLGGAVCLFCAAWFVCSGLGSERPLMIWMAEPTVTQIQALVHTAQDSSWLTTNHRHRLEKIRQANPVPQTRGSVDVFPWKLVTAVAHGLDLQPRPVMQSYAAYTDKLLEANRSFFAGDRAPQTVLLSVSPIHNRLPTMSDGPAWQELLCRYQPLEAVDGTLRLDRLPHPRSWQRELICSDTLSWDETWSYTPTPQTEADGWLLCRIDCRPNLAGKLATTLYRLPPVELQITVGSQTHGFRLIPACARAGFLLSPLVTTSEDLTRLWSMEPRHAEPRSTPGQAAPDQHLRSLTISTSVDCCFQERIELQLWRLSLQPASSPEPHLATSMQAGETPANSR